MLFLIGHVEELPNPLHAVLVERSRVAERQAAVTAGMRDRRGRDLRGKIFGAELVGTGAVVVDDGAVEAGASEGGGAVDRGILSLMTVLSADIRRNPRRR